MNQNFIILLLVVIIIGVVMYYNTNSKKERDPGGTPAFEVVGISVSKTENYKPWFTETYTTDEYIAMSQGANFVYTFKINGGVDLLQNLSITRKRADGGSDQIEEVPESKWVKGVEIQVDFPVQTGENAKGEHEFSINYTTPDINATGIMPYAINITENLLSVKLENGGTEELEMVPVETSGINVAFSAEREEIYIYDSEEVVNFNAQGPVYMSPVAGTNGKGFKLEGVTDIPHTLYRVKYRGGYLLALSQNANFTDTEYLTTDKSKKKFKEGELINKLFYITTDADSAGDAKNFFLDLAENVGSSAPAPDLPIESDPLPTPPDQPPPPSLGSEDIQPIPDPPVDPSPSPPAVSLEIAKAGPFIINRNEGKNCHPNGQWKYIWYSAQHANDKSFCGALSDDECESKMMTAQWWTTGNNNTKGDFRGGDMQRCVLDPAPISETCSGPLTIGATISNGSFEPINFGTKSTSGVGGYIFGVKAKTDIRITCISCLSKHPDPYGRQKGTDDGRVVMYRLKPGRSRFRSWCPSGRWSCDSGNASFPRDYDHTINSNESDWTLIGEALPSGGNWSDTTLNVSEDVSAGQIAYFYINSTMDGYMTVGQKSLDYQRLPEVGDAGVLYSDEQCELGFGFGVYGGSESEGNLGEPFLDKYKNYHVHPEWLRLSYQKIS